MFSAPIPGQSLTSEPKNSTWENPPQIAEPELSKNLISAVTAPLSTSVMPLQYLDEQAKDLSAKVLDQAKRDIIEHSVQ